MRSRCGLTEEVLEKMVEAELDEKGCSGLGCFNREQNSGFDKVDVSFFLNRPSGRRPWGAAPHPRVPGTQARSGHPLLAVFSCTIEDGPSSSSPTDGKGMTWKFCSHPVNQACGHT